MSIFAFNKAYMEHLRQLADQAARKAEMEANSPEAVAYAEAHKCATGASNLTNNDRQEPVPAETTPQSR